jgi:SAM-dependent methyltransferase
MEGYDSPKHQRDLSVTFVWGHDHDFGEFDIKGIMGSRHIDIIDKLVGSTFLGIKLTGKHILDIGCWTGGTSMLLSAMGAKVDAVEEVRKYAECSQFLFDSFDIDAVCYNKSLYRVSADDLFFERDYVLMFGVLYHLTDPVLALRIAFNYLKDYGWLFLETAVTSHKDSICEYKGPSQVVNGGRPRVGWNWFIPSITALTRMLSDVGFESSEIVEVVGGRAIVAAHKGKHRDMLRAGLSRPNIR